MITLARSWPWWPVSIALAVCVATPQVAMHAWQPPLPSILRVTAEPRTAYPGDVVLLTIELGEAATSVEASVFSRTAPLFEDADGHTWRGLVGIDLATKAGNYDVAIVSSQPSGVTRREAAVITVRPKRFPVRRLTVDPAFVNPPAHLHDRIAREAERLARTMDNVTRRRLWEEGFLPPVPGAWNSSFGKRTVFNGTRTSLHAGTDFSGTIGTPVQAPSAGRIALADDLYYSGNTVIIDHGLGLYSLLAHLSRIDVHEGDAVAPGAIVGRVGATGRVTGPHLHWAIRLNGARVDPVSLMRTLPARHQVR